MLVRFGKRWRNYNTGEIAGFDDAMAQDIITSGFAVEHVEGDQPEAEALPDQGGDGAGDQPQAEAQKRRGRAKAEPLPLQGAVDTVAGGEGAETVAGGDGSDTVTGDQSAS